MILVTDTASLVELVRTFTSPDPDAVPSSVTVTITMTAPDGTQYPVPVDTPAPTIVGPSVTAGGRFRIPDESASFDGWAVRWVLDGDLQASFNEVLWVARSAGLVASETP